MLGRHQSILLGIELETTACKAVTAYAVDKKNVHLKLNYKFKKNNKPVDYSCQGSPTGQLYYCN